MPTHARLRSLILFASLAGSVVLSGCWEASEPEAPAPEPAAVKAPAASVEPGSPSQLPMRSRVKQGAAAAIADNFPDDVPSYPESTPVRSVRQKSGRLMARFMTADGPANVLDYYREELVEKGWDLEVARNAEGINLLKAGKAGRSLSLMIPEPVPGGETAVTLLVSE